MPPTKVLRCTDNVPMLEKEYRAYLKLEKGLSANSVDAYERDYQCLKTYMDKHGINPVRASFHDL